MITSIVVAPVIPPVNHGWVTFSDLPVWAQDSFVVILLILVSLLVVLIALAVIMEVDDLAENRRKRKNNQH